MDGSHDDLDLELSKILAKVMQYSYKRHECQEIVDRVISKLQKRSSGTVCEENVRALRKEFENIRRRYYGLQ